ncbi:MAG: D-alanine--poly(phosphoribitol) ligase subunit DltC [Eubacterium sp.]
MEEKILELLEEVCEDDIIREERDMDLFEEDILDSLGFAKLLMRIEDELGVVISPSEIVRDEINTANKIIALVQKKKQG